MFGYRTELPGGRVNQLYYGDNLDVLRRHISDESVDLVYLDPPFNSNATYNVLFEAKDGTQAAAQIKAFEDTWTWDEAAAAAYHDTVEAGGKVADALIAFRTLVGDSNMLAYLAMMAPRLVELRRVLKNTGSIYLHCDPTASHYLKLLMDAVFGSTNFLNEIIWKRTSAHSDVSQGAIHLGRIHDVILWYRKSEAASRNPMYVPYSDEYVEKIYRYKDPDGRRYQTQPLHAKQPGGDTRYEWKGQLPPPGRYWAFSKGNMERLDSEGRIVYSRNGVPRYKIYLDEAKGRSLQDIWDDITPVHALPSERLGYPTQKPETLLDRIIEASTNAGDVVLDPFCGCGTAVASAQKLGRCWIGIDVTHLAIGLIKTRLLDSFGDKAEYDVIGEPTTVEDAATLAEEEPYQFQAWALGLVGARGAGPIKKGADKGIDGRLYFHDEAKGKTKQVVISVKAGKLHANYVRDLGGVVASEKADIGVLISFDKPTKAMRAWAAGQGFYESPWGKHPRIQLLTVEELLGGKRIDMPDVRGANVTYKRAPEMKRKAAERQLEFGADSD
jgi:DNA modification methylase